LSAPLFQHSTEHDLLNVVILGEWCQTINIRKTRPLLKSGLLNLSLLQELPHVTFLSNIHKGKPEISIYIYKVITSVCLSDCLSDYKSETS